MAKTTSSDQDLVDDGQGNPLGEYATGVISIRRRDEWKFRRQYQRCPCFAGEQLCKTHGALFAVHGRCRAFGFGFRVKPDGLHLSARRTRASTSSAGMSFATPGSTSAIRRLSSSCHAASTSGSSPPSSAAGNSSASRVRCSGDSSSARLDDSLTKSVIASLQLGKTNLLCAFGTGRAGVSWWAQRLSSAAPDDERNDETDPGWSGLFSVTSRERA